MIVVVFLTACGIGFLLGIVQGIRNWIDEVREERAARKAFLHDLELQWQKDELRRVLIRDKIEAHDKQLEAYTGLLCALDDELQYTRDEAKRRKIATKQADIMLKLATTAEKAQKLRDKLQTG